MGRTMLVGMVDETGDVSFYKLDVDDQLCRRMVAANGNYCYSNSPEAKTVEEVSRLLDKQTPILTDTDEGLKINGGGYDYLVFYFV